jgi:hypothetical protein
MLGKQSTTEVYPQAYECLQEHKGRQILDTSHPSPPSLVIDSPVSPIIHIEPTLPGTFFFF